MNGFTDRFPMPISRYTMNRTSDIEAAGQVYDGLRYRLNTLRASGLIFTKIGGTA